MLIFIIGVHAWEVVAQKEFGVGFELQGQRVEDLSLFGVE